MSAILTLRFLFGMVRCVSLVKCCPKEQGNLHHSEVGEETVVGGGFLVEGKGIGSG